MIPEHYKGLVQKLISKTKEGKLTWEVGTNQYEHLTTLRDKSIVLRKKITPSVGNIKITPNPPNWDERISFYLKNADGETMDSFKCSDLEEGWSEMEKLFRLAHAHATNIEEAINELEDQLESL